MRIAHYEINLEKMRIIIRDNHFKKILVQLPDGLKNYTDKLHRIITDKNNVQILFSGDPCFGACDIPCLENLNLLGIDAIFQIGHTQIPCLETFKKKIPIYYINALSTYETETVISQACKKLIGKNIAIATTAQYLHRLDHAESFLKSKGFKPFLIKGDKRIESKGQILGCNFSSIRDINTPIDSILYIGSGIFHPLGLLLALKKPVIIADPLTQSIKRDELTEIKDTVLRQRYTAISLAKTAYRFGIILCTKPGQQQYNTAMRCKELLEEHKKEIYVFIMDHIAPFYLENYLFIDCFVSTACPRIAIDDYNLYKTPMINPFELKISLGLETFDQYQFDEITSCS